MDHLPPPWLWPRAAYFHIPFCAHRCSYCDFAIAVGKDDLADRYIDALLAEVAMLGTPQILDTLFFGGGTPSQLTPGQLDRLLSGVKKWLILAPEYEFSLEANPESLGEETMAVLAAHGVNRISLGAQSFHPHLLQRLGRIHNPDEVQRAVERVHRYHADLSLDLIFGVPEQTSIEWETDLNVALSLKPDHMSTYGLTYEKGTPLWKDRRAGVLTPQPEESELHLYRRAITRLTAAGFEHYETSNFARAGHRCRHNGVYWANHAYFGFGMGAAYYINGRRGLNTRDLATYLKKVLVGESATFQVEELSSEERARETMALGLRRAEGVCRGPFLEQTAFSLDTLAGEAIAGLAELGLIDDDGDRICLTDSGKVVADAVIERLL